MIHLLSKTLDFSEMIELINKTYDFIEIDKFAKRNWKGVISEEEKKEKPALLTRPCPPGLALVGPDMSEVKVLVQFRTFQVQNLVVHEISR